ncbi:MAG: hypothetical protein F6K24_52030, partial [Okeania sp. SIO2D1]|nr:hypothetical protein [Okeania sp. SIO2D1]
MNINHQALLLTILVICIIIPSVKYRARGGKFQFDDDPDVMEQEILRLIPLGSSIEKAKEIMENNGFQCEYFENDSFVRVRDDPNGRPRVRQTLYENVCHLYCDISKGLIVQRRWQASIVHERGVVSRTLEVFAGLIDYIKDLDWTQTDVDRAIIATIQ